MTDASVWLWGRQIAAVSWLEDRNSAVFQYDADFANSGIQPAPLQMPLRPEPYAFPALPRESFKGLPGLLADSLPDKFGNRLIDAWLAAQGRQPASFNPVERLCYVGSRGMGALEFRPALGRNSDASHLVELDQLVRLANIVLNERNQLVGQLSGKNDKIALQDILRVGTSAGGARAKAVLAWNPATGEFRSGQTDTADGFQHWLVKFDGVSNNSDKELADPPGYGRIEYAYHLMARAAGIHMAECRLHEESDRAHFMTRRFDRNASGGKWHMQSLAALQHFDFNDPLGYSHEQAMLTIRQLGLGMAELEQQFARAAFNIIARNQDDHVKNIAFLMDRAGNWSLSPAYDVTYAWQPGGQWTSRHQMSVNFKRDGFVIADLLAFAATTGIKTRKAAQIIGRVRHAVAQWPHFAEQAGVSAKAIQQITTAHRLFH